MAAIRSKNTKPERLVREELRRLGLTGYRVHPRLPGRPDIAFTRWRVAVFTDGAFWHGHRDHPRPGATEYWRAKIARTQERDRLADAELHALGWTVIRMWDFDVLTDPATAAQVVATALAEAGRPPVGVRRPGASRQHRDDHVSDHGDDEVHRQRQPEHDGSDLHRRDRRRPST